MPKPEIARRCPSCGVSIRVRSSFCPQCGQELTPKSKAARQAKDTDTLATGVGAPGAPAGTPSSLATAPLNSEEIEAQPTAVSTSPSAPRKQPKQATIGMVHHSEPPPREVFQEDGINRVEKFRQLSSAVIDEATYDPSLRFVIVAAALFLLFLVLLILSELI